MRGQERKYSAGCAERQDRQNNQSVPPPLKLKVQQQEDSKQADRDDNRKSLLFFAQRVKLTRPGVRVALRKLNFGSNLLLQILDGGCEVTVPHAEFDRYVAAAAFAVNHKAAFPNGDFGDLRQRYSAA